MRLFNDSDYLKGFTDSQIWWLFLSGIFSRLNAIQYKDLDILLPKNEVLVNS